MTTNITSSEVLEKIKEHLCNNNILFFEGSEKQYTIGYPWLNYIQIPSENFLMIYGNDAIEYCLKNGINITTQTLAPQECDVTKCRFYLNNGGCQIGLHLSQLNINCDKNPNCYYKQLHSQQKNCQHSKKIDGLDNLRKCSESNLICTNLKSCELKNMSSEQISNLILSQQKTFTVEEIKRISNDLLKELTHFDKQKYEYVEVGMNCLLMRIEKLAEFEKEK